MKVNSLRRWCRPRMILVISNRSENPAHTLEVVTRIRATRAKVYLVQLPGPVNSMRGSVHDFPFLVTDTRTTAEEPSVNGTRQAFLWAEILSEVTIVKNTPIERIPALADSLGAELVVLTIPAVGLMRFRNGNGFETDLFASLPLPILTFGPRMDMSVWNRTDFRRILLPITFGPDQGLQLRFACRFARRYQGRVTVLHVFESRGTDEQPWERTPVAVEAKLPISELRHEGILCPLEIAVSEGYAARQILNFHERKGYDLIIMGGPHLGSPARGLGHGVTEAVIAEARCPVLMLGRAIESISASTDLSTDSRLRNTEARVRSMEVN
jgi:nucleotide-binding universal stress UspA family protein